MSRTLTAGHVLAQRCRSVRQSDDSGSILAIALVMLLIFGLWIGTVLTFATASQRTTVLVRDEATSTYAGGGAIDGTINKVRTSLSTGTTAAGASTCFTLPAGALDNTSSLAVTCDPVAGSGTSVSSLSQPDKAILATSTVAGEGVTVASGNLRVKGSVSVNKTLTVPAGSTLDDTGYGVDAAVCTVAGTVTPACTTNSGVTTPSYGTPDLTAPTWRATLPSCGASTITLRPGLYTAGSALQTVLNCANAVIILASGTYWFDFTDAATANRALTFTGGVRGTSLIGGARLGATSTCDSAAGGVELVFGGDSRLSVSNGSVDLCALALSGDTTRQHIVVRGLTSTTSVAGSMSYPPTTGSSAASVSTGSLAWTNPAGVLLDDSIDATASLSNGSAKTATMRLSLPPALVPPTATGISLTVSADVAIDSPGTTTALTAAVLGANGTLLGNRTIRSCASTACTPSNYVVASGTAITGLTTAQVNGGGSTRIDVNLVKQAGVGTTTSALDVIKVDLTYSVPLRRVCNPPSGAAACPAALPPTQPLLVTSGAYPATRVQLHGTVYAPDSAITLGGTLIGAPVVDRGIVIRHLVSTMTPGSGYSGALLATPDISQSPRQMVLTARDGSGTQVARARVTFADSSGSRNGPVPTVTEWTIN